MLHCDESINNQFEDAIQISKLKNHTYPVHRDVPNGN